MGEGVPQLLTLLEVSEALRVSTHTVRSWVRQGRLRPVRICRRLLFHPDEVARFLAGSETYSADARGDSVR
jgi:excisionase family DNA binding protein